MRMGKFNILVPKLRVIHTRPSGGGELERRIEEIILECFVGHNMHALLLRHSSGNNINSSNNNIHNNNNIVILLKISKIVLKIFKMWGPLNFNSPAEVGDLRITII